MSSGELLVVAAGDDVSLPTRCARLAEAWLASGRRLDLIASALEDLDERGTVHARITPADLASYRSAADWIARPPFVVGAAQAWTRRLFDRFGPLPDAAANLLGVIRLKIGARKLGVAAVDVSRDELVFTAAESTRIDPKRLVTLLTHPTLGIRVAPNHKIYAPLPGERDAAQMFKAAHELLAQLGG